MKRELNHNEIIDLVRRHEMSLHRELMLEQYYKNNNVINRTVKGEGKSNHKIAHPFAHQIVSTLVGYFASEPVQFDIENEQVKIQLDDFLKYNDFDRVFTKIITDACIYGTGSLMTFIDQKGLVRFSAVDPKEIIVLVNNDVLEDIHTVIRHWQVEDSNGQMVRYVEIYDSERVRKFYIDEKEVFSLHDANNYAQLPLRDPFGQSVAGASHQLRRRQGCPLPGRAVYRYHRHLRHQIQLPTSERLEHMRHAI